MGGVHDPMAIDAEEVGGAQPLALVLCLPIEEKWLNDQLQPLRSPLRGDAISACKQEPILHAKARPATQQHASQEIKSQSLP